MRKNIAFIFIVLMLMVILTACGKSEIGTNKTVKAYGLIGGCFIGEVTIKTNRSGKVVDIGIEEYYMPIQLFKCNNYENQRLEDDQKESVITVDGMEVDYVKHIAIGNEVFELYTTEFKQNDISFEPKRYKVDYRSKSKLSLNTYISTDDGGEFFVKRLSSGDVTIGVLLNGRYEMVAEANCKGGINKGCTEYLSEFEGSNSRALNIQLIKIKLMKEFNKNEIDRPSKEDIEKMQVESGATTYFFEDYIELAFKAYKKLT